MRSWVSLAFAGCLCVSAAAFVRAEPPSGDYAAVIGGEAEMWQPGGSTESCVSEQGINLCFVVTGATDVAGVAGGTGIFTFTGIAEGELVGQLSGAVSGSTEKTKVSVEGPLTGELVVDGLAVDIDGSVRLKCKEDPFDPALFQCKPKLKLCAYVGGEKLDCERVGGKSGEATVSAVGGPWTLRLALATDSAGNVTGDAEVELATGQLLAFTASGKYKAKSDSSKLKLIGVGPAANSKIKLSKLVLSEGGADAGKASFKLAGQKGKADLSPAN